MNHEMLMGKLGRSGLSVRFKIRRVPRKSQNRLCLTIVLSIHPSTWHHSWKLICLSPSRSLPNPKEFHRLALFSSRYFKLKTTTSEELSREAKKDTRQRFLPKKNSIRDRLMLQWWKLHFQVLFFLRLIFPELISIVLFFFHRRRRRMGEIENIVIFHMTGNASMCKIISLIVRQQQQQQ